MALRVTSDLYARASGLVAKNRARGRRLLVIRAAGEFAFCFALARNSYYQPAIHISVQVKVSL